MRLRTYLLCRILFTFIFMISSTIIWSKKDFSLYKRVETSVVSNEINFSNLKRGFNDDNVYHLKVLNDKEFVQDIKVSIVPTVLKNNISNNYIKYQINNSSIKSLNMDGVILFDKLDIHEEKEFSLKLWISDTYNGNLNYDGRVVVS